MPSTLRPASTRALLAAVRALGEDDEAMLDEVDLSWSDLSGGHRRMPADKVNALWAIAAQVTGHKGIGVLAAGKLEPEDYRAITFVTRHAPTIGVALQRAQALVAADHRHLSLQIEHDEASGLHTVVAEASGHRARAASEYLLAAVFKRLVEASTPRPVPVEVRMAFPRPDCVEPYVELFGQEPVFDAAHTAMVLDDADWHRPASRDAGLGHGPPIDLSDAVRQVVESLLVSGREVDLAAVSSALDTSTRSLQRHLRALGTTFADEVDAVRTGWACELLDDDVLALNEIAWLLGYTDVAAFARAFKRWTGLPPARWRSQHGSGR